MFRILLGSLLTSLALLPSAFALKSVTLAWDPSPTTDLSGYRIKYGTSSGSYNQTIDVGNATTATVPNLSEGGTYFFAVIALGSSAIESLPSNEVSLTVAVNQPPTVNITNPADGTNAVSPVTITLGAAAADSDGTISRVEFYNGSTKLGEDTTSPYSYAYAVNAAGTYTFKARAFDNAGASAESVAVTVTVTAPPPASSPTAISTVSYVAGTGVQLTVSGTPGQSQSIFASSDLKTWTLLSTAVNSTGTLSLNDSGAANLNQRFYRVTDGTTTSEPVGFSKLRIAGLTGSQTSTYSYLGINLVNPTSYQGAVTSRGTESITDSGANWTDNQFNGANGEFYLEITSGPAAGTTTDILSTSAATKTLTLDDDLSSLLAGGEQYRIRKHRTIDDVFGKNNAAKLKSSTTVSSSDEVRLFNPVTQAFLVYYYNSTVSGWRSSTSATADASSTKLYMDQGVAIRRRAAGDITLVVTGAVKTGPTIIPIGVNSNLCANMYPAGTLTLGNCGLYTGNAATGLMGAGKVGNADEVQIWTGSAFRRYFYKTSGTGGVGWRASDSLSSDARNLQIPIGSSIYVVRKRGRLPFNWNLQQPF